MPDRPEPRLQRQLAEDQSALLLGLFDADGRLSEANPAFLAAWGRPEPAAGLDWLQLATQALDGASGPALAAHELPREQALRGRLAHRAFEQAWRDGRSIWWVETRTAEGWLWCVGSDVSALARSGRRQRAAFEGLSPPDDTLSDAPTGLRLLAAALAEPRAWPLGVALLAAAAEGAAAELAQRALASCRREDACARLDDGQLLLILPTTGPAQAQAVVERLLGNTAALAGLVQARWGEDGPAVLARLRERRGRAATLAARLASDSAQP